MINEPAHTSWLFRGTMSTPVYLWRIPDALIGKLEGLKPPRVALVSLHLGAFSFPESETMFPVSNPIATPNARTMSSREIADIAEARHNDLVATIDRLFDKGLLRSSRKTRHENTGGRPIEVYDLVERDVYLIVAGYSDEVRARIIDRWQELEARQALQPQQAASNVFALAMVESMARTLRMSDSGVLLMYRQVASVYAPEAVSAIPVYAIDAPTTATSAPTSSMPTASLTVLLKDNGITMSAATVNRMLANVGMLEEMTRPSSKGTVKKFWSVTEAGQKYGKNVTSPSNPKETQPHWYRDTFNELVRLHLVA